MMRLHRDERGVVTAFIIRTVIVFALVALVAEEAGQLILGQIRASNAAGAGAKAGADEYHGSKSVDAAKRAAVAAAMAKEPKAVVTSVEVASDGVVTVTVDLTANTLIISRVSFLKKYGMMHATEKDFHTLA